MAERILTHEEIESISISKLINAQPQIVVTNTGLSEELIEELSREVSDDYFITLVRMKLNDVWYNFSNDKTEYVGIDADGRPIHKTVWNGEDWAYLPFDMALSSIKSSGEIVGTEFSVANFDEEIARAFENPRAAIPIKSYVISKNTFECVAKNEHKYIMSYGNAGIMIQGQIQPADVLSETIRIYSKINFR